MLIWYYRIMAKFTFELDDSLDEKFRKTVAQSKGLRRGVIQQAITEAIQAWIGMQAKSKK
jgi:predicted transcriptional regulator